MSTVSEYSGELDNLHKHTVTALKKICKNQGFDGYSSMRKKELVIFTREQLLIKMIDEGIQQLDEHLKLC